MPLDEEIELLNCRTGNHVPFHFFQLKHCLPVFADLIMFQNFASRILARFVRTAFFPLFIPFTSFPAGLARDSWLYRPSVRNGS